MPTGVHLHDARRQLFDAAERVLLRDGPSALTSRVVAKEADCAKGVLHRHFTDFDSFLVELVLDRMTLLEQRAEALRASVGTGRLVDNIVSALVDLFGPVPMAIIPMITFRDELRAKLREVRPEGGIVVLSDATEAVIAYLVAERDMGRIDADADAEALAMSLVGGGHLLFSDRDSERPGPARIERFVAGVVEGALAS